jgi:hypothetical protein
MGVRAQVGGVVELHKRAVFSSVFLYLLIAPWCQIWAFNLVYIYAYCSFCQQPFLRWRIQLGPRPFLRRSKLTLLMKDVFDISCQRMCSTVVLAHVSPLARDVKHSTSTLQYSAPLRVSVRRQTAKSYQRDERDPALWSHEQLCEWVAQTSPDPRVLGGSLVAQGDGGLVLCMVNEGEFFKRVRAVLAPCSPEEEASAGAAAQALYSTLWTLICDAKVRRRRPNGSIITAEEEAAEIAEIARRGEEKAALWKEREAHMKSDLVGYDGKPL